MGAGGGGSAGEKPTAFNPMRFLKPVCQGTEQNGIPDCGPQNVNLPADVRFPMDIPLVVWWLVMSDLIYY